MVAKLESYYGGKRCVVKQNSAEWHHLDDDANKSTFCNLIPLASDLNESLGKVNLRAEKHRTLASDLNESLGKVNLRAEKHRTLFLPPTLSPKILLGKAEEHFVNWEYGLPYGCARLAYFISLRYLGEAPSERLPKACVAFYYARHHLNYELINDVLSRDFLPTLDIAPKISSRLNRCFREVRLK